MKNKTIKGYKFIQSNMKSKNGNQTWKVGEWYKIPEEDIKICNKGFHACKQPRETLEYVYGDKFFIVEAKGKIIEEGDKIVASEMRLVQELDTSKIFKRFAIFCAKQCLKNYEKKYPNDKRPFEAIEGAELYLDGKIDLAELNKRISAAWSAAESAAESAAWSAAESAARSAWYAARSAWYAARSAAESAARSAAESAAESAAWSAAESAARSAWYAARSAWYAARSAAESAAESAQNKELLRLIKLELKCKK